MEEITRQVARARRRLLVQQFLTVVTWSIFVGLVVAAVALAVPKVFFIESLQSQQAWTIWVASWIGGSLAAGLMVAMIWTFVSRRQPIEAAIEIDRRFQLKERISSALSLAPADVESEAGRALLDDAARRVERIDVKERFGLSLNWTAALPLVPALIMFLLFFLGNATSPKQTIAKQQELAIRKRVETSEERFKQQLAKKREKLEEKGLQDAAVMLKEIEQRFDKDNERSKIDQKDALVRLNDVKKELDARRKQLGDSDNMRKQLNQLKDLKRGPADKVIDAIKNGDFNAALEELKEMSEKVKNGELTDEERKQLEEQLNALKEKLNEHENEKKDLEEKIKKAEAEGNKSEVERLQKQLDQLKEKDDEMQGLSDLAQKLGECSDCLKRGDNQGAAKQLDQIAQQLQELQDELDELETLDDVMDEIAQAKNAMNCDQCGGEGCEACMGNQFGQGMGGMRDMPGMGLGEGNGFGPRPEQEHDTSSYNSGVRGDVRQGEAVRTGSAGGPNLAGRSTEEVKQAIESSLKQDTDPLTDQKLPRDHREHAREYFEKFRKGG